MAWATWMMACMLAGLGAMGVRVWSDGGVMAIPARSGSISPVKERWVGEKKALFVAVISGSNKAVRRAAVRETWLSPLWRQGCVDHVFYVDDDPELRGSLEAEARQHGDVEVVMRGERTTRDSFPAARFVLEALAHAREVHRVEERYRHVAVLDDDGFLATGRVVSELKSRPETRFYWAKWWCYGSVRETPAAGCRPDQNFQVMSTDLVTFIGAAFGSGRPWDGGADGGTGLLPFDSTAPGSRWGAEFGYWLLLMNVTLFDDQDRIDSQQSPRTYWFHLDLPGGGVPREDPSPSMIWRNDDPGSYCDRFVWGHVGAYTFSGTHCRGLFAKQAKTKVGDLASLREALADHAGIRSASDCVPRSDDSFAAMARGLYEATKASLGHCSGPSHTCAPPAITPPCAAWTGLHLRPSATPRTRAPAVVHAHLGAAPYNPAVATSPLHAPAWAFLPPVTRPFAR